MKNEMNFTAVPPPEEAILNNEADALGLCVGIRVEKANSQWRCNCCHQMQRPNGWWAWIPDSVKLGDPEWSVTEACRQNVYNGHLSAWCLSCARQLGNREKKISMGSKTRWWKFWRKEIR